MVEPASSSSYGGGWSVRTTGEAEVAVSQHHATAFQPGWHRETLSQKKKKRKERKNDKKKNFLKVAGKYNSGNKIEKK